jgi:hypothetical protein
MSAKTQGLMDLITSAAGHADLENPCPSYPTGFPLYSKVGGFENCENFE